jgi:hypothetical protein
MRTFLIHKQKPFQIMNNTIHTPGPWYIAHHTEIDGGQSIDIRHCCDIPPAAPEIHQIARLPENALADARLIAAAPDLLSALESLAVWNDGEPCFCHVHGESERARYTPHDSYCDKARATLRKAKGEA